MAFTLPNRIEVSRLGWAAYGLAGLTVVLDQLSKAWFLSLHLAPAERLPVIPPIFYLASVANDGVSFGLLKAHNGPMRWVLVGLALVVAGILADYARKTTRPLIAAALGLIIGGAVGNNLIDRVRYGSVVDFLDFSGLYFPWVFNVADSAITVGVVLLIADLYFAQKKA